MELKFLKCSKCGQIIAVVKDTGVPIICCGEPMQELVAGSVDAAVEKHVPCISQEGSLVTINVGDVDHPMIEEHYIEWIALRTKFGNQRKLLNPGDKPCAKFVLLEGDEVIEAYAYCNLHGLWKK